MAELFVKQARTYARIRPSYPASMFQMISQLTHRHQRAWDVGTGNGQAATMLAQHYDSVVATDVSEEQLSLAAHDSKVTYSRMSATPSSPDELEQIVGAEGSVDVVTVAQAMHWFDLDKFYPIVKHVLRKPGGLIAAWCYGLPRVNPQVDGVADEIYKTSAPYWAAQVKYIDDEYRSIPFPFEPVREDGIGPHKVDVRREWTQDDYLYFWKSCSGVQTALDQGVDVVHEGVRKMVSDAWGPAEQLRTVTFRMCLLLGTVRAAIIS